MAIDFDSLPEDNAQTPIAAAAATPGAPANAPTTLPNFDQLPDDSDRNSSFGQKVLTGVEEGASLVTGGLSRVLEPALGNAVLGTTELNPGRQRARAEENPLSQIAGGIGGFATGLGAAGAINTAGAVAGAQIANPIISSAIKYGLENALASGTNEAGKYLVQDPGQTLGSAAANIGLSTLIGSTLGASGSGVKSLWLSRYGDKAASALDSAGEAIVSEAPQTPSGVTALKPNADEIQSSLDRLKLKPTPGTLSGDEFVQKIEGNLAERGSVASVALNRERGQVFNKLADASEETLSERTGQSQASIGSQIKKDIGNTLTENLKPIEDEYKALEPEFKKIPISDDLKIEAIDPVANHAFVDLDPESASLAKRVSGQIEGIGDVSDLRKVRTLVSSQLSAEYGAGQGSSPKAQILQTAKDALTNMRKSAITEAAENGIIKPDLLERINSADAQYSGFQNTVKQLGVEGGLGKANSARALLSKFSNLSDESFTKKVFDTGDVRNLEFFKQNFPEAFDKAKRFKLSEIYDSSIDHAQGKNGKFSTSKFLTQVRKLGSEAQQAIFSPEDLQKISDVQNVHEAIPGAPNTSATSYSQAFANILSPSGVVQNLTDAAQYAWLKALPHLSEAAELAGGDEAAKLAAVNFAANADKGTNPGAFKSTVDYIRASIKGQTNLSEGINRLFEGAKVVVPPHLIPDQGSRDKLQKAIDYASAPSNAFNPDQNSFGHYLPAHSVAAGQAIGGATSYLNSLKPTQPKNSPLDATPPVSKLSLQRYNRALDIAEQPLIVLKHVKNGSLLSSDVDAMRNIYPAFHDSMIRQITDKLINQSSEPSGLKLSYPQRVSLSLLIGGTPLDSTMTPAAGQAIIRANAGSLAASQHGAAQGQQRKTSGAVLSQINKVNKLYETNDQARLDKRRS